jgi:hypothetical protein
MTLTPKQIVHPSPVVNHGHPIPGPLRGVVERQPVNHIGGSNTAGGYIDPAAHAKEAR